MDRRTSLGGNTLLLLILILLLLLLLRLRLRLRLLLLLLLLLLPLPLLLTTCPKHTRELVALCSIAHRRLVDSVIPNPPAVQHGWLRVRPEEKTNPHHSLHQHAAKGNTCASHGSVWKCVQDLRALETQGG